MSHGKKQKYALTTNTPNIRHLSHFSTNEFESSIIVLPSIFLIIPDSIGSIHTISRIYSAKMQNDIAESIDIFLRRCPVWTSNIHLRFHHEITIRITICAVSSILWKSEKWRKRSIIQARVPDSRLEISTSRNTISTSTWTNRPSPILSLVFSIEFETLIPAIIGEKWGGFVSSEKPTWFHRWSFWLCSCIATCPYLPTDDDISTITSRICECLGKWKECCDRECKEKKFFHI